MKLKELASIVKCSIIGDGSRVISAAKTLKNATENDISFFNNSKYLDDLSTTRAGACILREEDAAKVPAGVSILTHKSPYVAWATVLSFLYPDTSEEHTISELANIDKSAIIGQNCCIEPGVYIGKNVCIGNNCIIRANSYIGDYVVIGDDVIIDSNVTIMFSVIGSQCVIRSGARIGQDGFGFATDGERVLKVKQLGRVILEDNVQVGANTCIDRGALDDTIIGKNTKIDNLVQIAHNVVVGSNCFMAAQVGIAGSSRLGNFVMLGGQAGIAGHLKIEDYAIVSAQSGVMSDIKAKEVVGGSPSCPVKQWHRQTIALKKLTSK